MPIDFGETSHNSYGRRKFNGQENSQESRQSEFNGHSTHGSYRGEYWEGVK